MEPTAPQAPIETAPNTTVRTATLIALLVVVLAAAGLAYEYSLLHGTQTDTKSASGVIDPTDPVDQKLVDTYALLESGVEDPTTLTGVLTTFRDIAINEKNKPVQRAKALNGINFAYPLSNFNSSVFYATLFSMPPFDAYYAKSATTSDVLHPETVGDDVATEGALVRLSEVSNTLVPNHFAIARIEVVENLFAYQREAYGKSAEERSRLAKEYAARLKVLAAAYDALPPLETVPAYGPLMREQILLAHSSSLAFIGQVEKDPAFLSAGEDGFKAAIAFASTYPRSKANYLPVFDEALLNAIYYNASYWSQYKDTDPEHIMSVLRPLLANSDVTKTRTYTVYLPSHKNATVTPFNALRQTAQKMPELKAFLEGAGWSF